MEGKRASFSALIKRYSGDIPVRALLDELRRVGAVKQLKDGRICLLARGYIPRKGPVEKLKVLGSDTADLIATIDHNVYQKPTTPRFQRKVMYDNVPVEAAKEFQILAAAQGQELLEAIDRWKCNMSLDGYTKILWKFSQGRSQESKMLNFWLSPRRHCRKLDGKSCRNAFVELRSSD